MQLLIAGGGRMGEAFLAGLLRAGWCQPADVVVVELDETRREELRDTYGVGVNAGFTGDFAEPAILLVAVKPKDVPSCLEGAGWMLGLETLVISIAAGVAIATIEAQLPPGLPVVRVMPNLAATVGEAASGFAGGSNATAAHLATAREVLSAVGSAIEVPESLIDAVTAVSGSGPAYVFLLAEAVQAAAEDLGLPAEAAAELTRRTFSGAARLLDGGEASAAELREAVTSPGGTTQAAMEVFEAAGFRQTVIDAVRAAASRARELDEEGGRPG